MTSPPLLIVVPVHEEEGWCASPGDTAKARLEAKSPSKSPPPGSPLAERVFGGPGLPVKQLEWTNSKGVQEVSDMVASSLEPLLASLREKLGSLDQAELA